MLTYDCLFNWLYVTEWSGQKDSHPAIPACYNLISENNKLGQAQQHELLLIILQPIIWQCQPTVMLIVTISAVHVGAIPVVWTELTTSGKLSVASLLHWTLAIFGLHLRCVKMSLAGAISAVWNRCWRDILLKDYATQSVTDCDYCEEDQGMASMLKIAEYVTDVTVSAVHAGAICWVNWLLPPANCRGHLCCTRWALAILELHIWCVNMTLAGATSGVWSGWLLRPADETSCWNSEHNTDACT